MISPKESQIFGFIVSVVTGLVVFAAVWGFIGLYLDFWYLDEVLAPVAGIILGGLSGYAMFAFRQREIPLNWVGVSLCFGKPTTTIYENGNHWVFPFFGIRNVPAKTERFILKMPGEKFNAQDGALVYFGISEEPEKRNRIQYSIVNPRLYIAVDNPEDELREAYLQEARLFFGQASRAIGVKNEQTLFSNYIVLPPKTGTVPPEEHTEFKARLERAGFTPRGGEEHSEGLFSKSSVQALMDNAGNFLQTADRWGIGKIFAFTPNVRENPEAEAADAERQATVARMTTLQMKATQVKASAKGFVEDGVSPDLAAAMAAKLGGEDIEIENKTFTISGLPGVIQTLGGKIIDAVAKSKGGN